MTIDNLSLSTHGYQLLPLATSQLVSNNRSFGCSGIFSPTIKDLLLKLHGYQLLPLATS